MTLEKQIIGPNATIRDALSTLNAAAIKLCLAVDASGKLTRTVSDGDIRRALLSQGTMATLISSLPQRPPLTIRQPATDAALQDLFNAHPDVNAIAMVDDNCRPIDLVSREKYQPNLLLSPPHIGLAEIGYVQQAFDDNWIAPAGPNLEAFERALAQVSGRNAALALSSGTAAIHLALRVIGISPNDRVYVSDLTFAASLQPILYERALPVLIDSEPTTWNMSPVALARRLEKDSKDGTLPKAIIVVHLYGQSADMASLLAISNQYKIPLIEDAAESLGATCQGAPSGSHGLLAAYSFNGNKIITTSGGGALVSDRADLIQYARKLSTQGRETAEHYQHSEVAYNYRMSNVLAGIGLGQLELLANRVNKRRLIFQRYRDALSNTPGISFQADPPNSVGNRWLTVITLDPNIVHKHVYQLMRYLRAHGIESRPAWKPMHMQPLCSDYALETHSETDIVSSRLFLQSLCLPSGSNMTWDDQKRVITAIQNFAKEIE